MNLDVRWTPVRFERVTGESSLSAVVEGSLTLPVGSPPIHRIVRATAAPRLTDVQASNGEVTLEGVVDVSLLYAVSPEETDWSAASGEDDGDDAYDDGPGAFMPREALHRALWLRELPFHGVVAVPGAASGGDVIPKVDVEEVKAYADGDGRTAHVDVVLTASVRVVAPEEAAVPEMAVPTGDDAEGLLRRERLLVQTCWGRRRQTISLRGRLRLSPDAPPIARAADVGLFVETSRVTVGDGYADVDGRLNVHLAYVPADDMAGPLAFFGWEGESWTFTHRFDDVALTPGRRATVTARPFMPAAEPADDGRAVDVAVDVELTLEVGEEKPLDVVTGVSPAADDVAVETRSEPVSLQVIAGRGEQERAVTATLELPAGLPPIERLLAHEVRPVVAESLVLGDRLSVSGHVDVSLIYVGRDGESEEPVYVADWKGGIPFETDIPLPGAHPPMHPEVEVHVLELDPDLINRETVEWKGRLLAVGTAKEDRRVDAVVEMVVLGPPDPDPPTYTFLVVAEGDTVWKLSRRYRVPPEAIIAANPGIEDENSPLVPGSKLLIPRHRREALIPVHDGARLNGA